jgi:hypothetical protein
MFVREKKDMDELVLPIKKKGIKWIKKTRCFTRVHREILLDNHEKNHCHPWGILAKKDTN